MPFDHSISCFSLAIKALSKTAKNERFQLHMIGLIANDILTETENINMKKHFNDNKKKKEVKTMLSILIRDIVFE